jgi:hypothetical protein
VGRDLLLANAKNTLGSIVTLFQPSDEALAELEALVSGKSAPVAAPTGDEEESAELAEVRLEAVAEALEFLKDRLLKPKGPDGADPQLPRRTAWRRLWAVREHRRLHA